MQKRNLITFLSLLLAAVVLTVLFVAVTNSNKIEKEITPLATTFIELDEETIASSGFVNDIGVSQVIQHCTQCHSSRLVTQNRLSEAGWKATIEWMQETQNLWDLGKNEERIIAYLAKNYGPTKKGRRQPIKGIEWYELD